MDTSTDVNMNDWKKQFDEKFGKEHFRTEFGESIKAFISQVEADAYERGGHEVEIFNSSYVKEFKADAYERAAKVAEEKRGKAEFDKWHKNLVEYERGKHNALGEIAQSIRELKE